MTNHAKLKTAGGRILYGPEVLEESPARESEWEMVGEWMWDSWRYGENILAWHLSRPPSEGPRARRPAVVMYYSAPKRSKRGTIILLEVRKDLRREGLGSDVWKQVVSLHPEVQEWSLLAAGRSAARFWEREGWVASGSNHHWSPPPPSYFIPEPESATCPPPSPLLKPAAQLLPPPRS